MLYKITEDGEARLAKRVAVRREAEELRDLLARNPFLLPGDQIDPESPRRWLLIRKEMPVPGPGGGEGRWSVDLLLSDQSGVPTFVECKRFADTRSRREVVGQMLEYAANGHYYWDRGELRSYLEATVKEGGTSVEELLSEFDPEEVSTVDELLDRFVENLREGQVRLVFFMEEAPQELKSIVDFLNRQTERTEILIVEARVFDSSGSRFVVPKLFGYTEEARRAKRTVTVKSGTSRRKWDEESFFAHAGENLSDTHVQFLRTVLDTAQRLDYSVNWGTGTQRGSFSLVAQDFCRRSMASFFSDGGLWINLGWLYGSPEADAFRERVVHAIRDAVGLEPKGKGTDHWTYDLEEWFGRKDELLLAIEGLRWDRPSEVDLGPDGTRVV